MYRASLAGREVSIAGMRAEMFVGGIGKIFYGSVEQFFRREIEELSTLIFGGLRALVAVEDEAGAHLLEVVVQGLLEGADGEAAGDVPVRDAGNDVG